MIPIGRYSPTASLPSPPSWRDEYDDGFVDHAYKSLINGFLRVGSGLTGTLEWGVETIGGSENEFLSTVTNNIRQQMMPISDPDNAAEFIADIVGQAIPFAGAAMIGGAGGGAVAGKLGQYVGAAAVSFAVEGQAAYEEAKKRGASEMEASIERALVGGINAAIEASQVGQLLRFKDVGRGALRSAVGNIKKKALLKAGGDFLRMTPNILQLSINEGWQELLQEGVATLAPGLVEGKAALPLDREGHIDFVTIGKRMGTAALAGAVASPFLAAFGSVIPGKAYEGLNVPRIGLPTKEEYREAIDRVRNSDMPDAEKKRTLKELESGWEYYTGESLYDEKVNQTLEDIWTEEDVEAEVEPVEGRKRSRFPQKVKDESSLTEVGNAIAEYLGLGDWDITWNFAKGSLGNTKVLGPKKAAIAISPVTGQLLNPATSTFATQAGTRPRNPGEAYRYTQAELKRTIVHELGHLARPAIEASGKRAQIHHTQYTNWVQSGTEQLFKMEEPTRATNEYFRRVDESVGKMQHMLQKKLQKALTTIEKKHREKSKEKIRKGRGVKAQKFQDEYNKLIKAGEKPFVAFLRASAKLKGRLTSKFPSLLEQGFTEDDFNSFISMAHNSGLYRQFEFKRVGDALAKIFVKGELPQPNEIALLEPLLGKSSTELLRKLATTSEKVSKKVYKGALDAANLPRALLATWDFSAPGRQGILMLFADPKAFAKGAWVGFRSFVNEDYANYYNTLIHTHGMYGLAKEVKLAETKMGDAINTEEPFTSEMSHYFPLVKRSERAYVMSLNAMRFNAFYRIAEKWAGTGKSSEDYEMMASVLNHLTGRGDLKFFEDHAQFLNAMFFSPRLFMSRLQSISDLWNTHGATRAYVASTLVGALGTGSLILTLLHYIAKRKKDMDVEINPLSSDFGKIRIGNTRIDYWGGYSQIIRTLVQLAAGRRKSTQTQEIYKASTLDTFARFLQTKMSPAAGFALDVYRGEDFKGDIVSRENIPKEVYNRFTPLFIQDCLDAIQYQGLDGLMVTVPLALNGIGVMTYPQTETGKLTVIRNRIALDTFGKKWDQLGPDFQEVLKEHNPLIIQQENIARASKLGKKASAKFLDEQRSTTRKMRVKLGRKIVDQMDDLFVNFTGVSRMINSDWYLNDKRYKEYQAKVLLGMKQILPEILEADLPDEGKRLLIEDIIDRIKKNVREEIVFKANYQDFLEVNSRES